MKPDYSHVVLPLDPQSQIVSGLWQGMRPASYVGWDVVVSCEEHLARRPMEGFEGAVVHVAMRDEDDFVIPALAIDVAATAVHRVLVQNGNALVHCTGGLNRSSLVTAAVLGKFGYEPDEAVRMIRETRDDFCLCNRRFERWVLGEPLPTAETSAFRLEDGE